MPLAGAQEYPIWVNALVFLTGGILVWTAGTRLTHYLDAISQATGLGQAFVGMLLLGGITSLPELANSITASWIGSPALAVNNLLGSAAINVLLLAIADAFIGRDALTAVIAKPSTLMMATLCILVLVAMAMAITTGDVSVLGLGVWSMALCTLSIGAFWLTSGYGARAPWRVDENATRKPAERVAKDHTKRSERAPLRSLINRTLVAGIVIFAAGYSLSQTGDALAKQTGLGTSMVGFVLIGVSTSMPELSSITAALRLRRYEMAFGQILGTNFINLSLILVVDLVFRNGPVINQLGRFEAVSALLGALLIGVFLVGLLERRDPVFMRMGYDSLVVIVLFSGGLFLLYAIRPT